MPVPVVNIPSYHLNSHLILNCDVRWWLKHNKNKNHFICLMFRFLLVSTANSGFARILYYLASSPGSTQLFNVGRIQHWKAGWSLGTRLLLLMFPSDEGLYYYTGVSIDDATCTCIFTLIFYDCLLYLLYDLCSYEYICWHAWMYPFVMSYMHY